MRTRPWRFILLGYLLSTLPLLVWAEELRFSALPASLPLPRHARPSGAVDVLQVVARQHPTPKAIAEYLHREFRFARDEELFGLVEYWQTPEEFLTRKTGDCEDYALLARELLVRNGVAAHVFSLFGAEGYAHTVCIFADEHGRYNVLNQDKLRYYRANTLDELASQIYPAWTFGGITEQAGTRGRLVQEITNDRHPRALASVDDILPASSVHQP